MRMNKKYTKPIQLSLLFFSLIFVLGCSKQESGRKLIRKQNVKGEYIHRQQEEKMLFSPPLKIIERALYPWEFDQGGKYPKITKDFFRCKGCSLNPVRMASIEKNAERFYDCGGPQRHSLPLKNGKEFIYPILIDLLNAVQDQTGRRIVITCGHCCPTHMLYLDSSKANQTSKHQIGAEVDFYVEGMEEQPQKIVDLLLDYYKKTARYQGRKEFEFKRYEKGDTNTTIPPWFNKEVFIKYFKKGEGRDFDNRHLFPYISIQVRHDLEANERVQYTWDKAFRNFHRW